jgi:hypothetical protein
MHIEIKNNVFKLQLTSSASSTLQNLPNVIVMPTKQFSRYLKHSQTETPSKALMNNQARH